jgi:alpha-beta hydrolase superfamily lysophospholipase
MTMTLNLQDLQAIAQQMPALEFSPSQDSEWAQTALVQAYLNDYGINFAKEFAQVSHGFGGVKAAGFKIATQYWLPERAQGTLVLVHGYYDHLGIFSHPIRFALQHNFAVIGFDLPGHGLSSGEPAAIDSFNQYGDVLAEVLQQSAAIMPQPVYTLGQSTGCAVLMNYVWRYAKTQNALRQFAKMALCSPLVLPRGWRGMQMGSTVYAVLRHFLRQISRTFSNSSHDVEFTRFLKEQDPLQARTLPLSWVGAMKDWHDLLVNLEPLQNNCLIVQGTTDMTVEWQYNVPLLQQKLPEAKLVYIPGAGHQLVNESPEYRDQVFAAIEHYFFN